MPPLLAQSLQPATQLMAMTTRFPRWQSPAAANPNQLDAVTMPTPMGEIKFIAVYTRDIKPSPSGETFRFFDYMLQYRPWRTTGRFRIADTTSSTLLRG